MSSVVKDFEGNSRIEPDEPSNLLVSFVLDRSGSMGAIAEPTISGFNEYKDTLIGDNEVVFFLTLFNTMSEIVYDGIPAEKISDLDRDLYNPGGMTALLDAVGDTIDATEKWYIKNVLEGIRDDEEPEFRVLFVIMTDGAENSSRRFNHGQIKEKIEEKRAEGWEFLFLGANQDAWLSGTNLGVSGQSTRSFAATPQSIRGTYTDLAGTTNTYSRTGAIDWRDGSTASSEDAEDQ